jgi:hypothetical protein
MLRGRSRTSQSVDDSLPMRELYGGRPFRVERVESLPAKSLSPRRSASAREPVRQLGDAELQANGEGRDRAKRG